MCAHLLSISPIINEIGTVREGLAMNEITHSRRNDGFVLISDSLIGGVWKFDINTGKHELVIKDASLAGPTNRTELTAFGINGLRVQNDMLSYCNSGAQTFWKMQLHPNATSAGPAKIITSNIACDDFALDPHGIIAYVASPRNALVRLDTRIGAQLVVAGTFNESSSNNLSASSARFGTGYRDRGVCTLQRTVGRLLGRRKVVRGSVELTSEGLRKSDMAVGKESAGGEGARFLSYFHHKCH
ncbi:MAG: hypothetical protein L6R42_011027 [Xanthoria sp. 1 TBL-2021]|nr:MAG: hypothetical protein L6R42_011027 [Xanthoria sp. 1 TBL-2021]